MPRCGVRKRRRVDSEDEATESIGTMQENLAMDARAAKVETGTAFTTLTKLLEEFRSTLVCKICFRMLYEPFILHCGHTYCYGCLCDWFSSNSHNKTCPDCRTRITAHPAPAYTIREQVSKFIERQELLPEGETPQQHSEWKLEQTTMVERDRANISEGGLFRGKFLFSVPNRAVRDESDSVHRCPNCLWELMNTSDGGTGYCVQCEETVGLERGQRPPQSLFDIEVYDSDDQELDEDLEYEDEQFFEGHEGYSGTPEWDSRHPPRRTIRSIQSRVANENDDDDDEEDGSNDSDLEGFIVDDDDADEALDSSSNSDLSEPLQPRPGIFRSHGHAASRGRLFRTSPWTVDDNQDDDDGGSSSTISGQESEDVALDLGQRSMSDSEDSEDEDQVIRPAGRRIRRRTS